MKTFRDKHIQIVTRYILIQARRAAQTGQENVTGPGYHGMGPNANKVILGPSISPSNLDEIVRTDAMVKSDGLGDNSDATTRDTNGDAASSTDRGTGGTDIMPFLKQSRDETRDTKLNVK